LRGVRIRRARRRRTPALRVSWWLMKFDLNEDGSSSLSFFRLDFRLSATLLLLGANLNSYFTIATSLP